MFFGRQVSHHSRNGCWTTTRRRSIATGYFYGRSVCISLQCTPEVSLCNESFAISSVFSILLLFGGLFGFSLGPGRPDCVVRGVEVWTLTRTRSIVVGRTFFSCLCAASAVGTTLSFRSTSHISGGCFSVFSVYFWRDTRGAGTQRFPSALSLHTCQMCLRF